MADRVRLRPLDIERDLAAALRWYSDPIVLGDSEGGDTPPYDERTVRGMYAHLGVNGEVLIIEVLADSAWTAIGDAVLHPNTLPIVIGHPAYRSRGIGTTVLRRLIEVARARGWTRLRVRKVCAYNERSQALYRSAGFVETGRTIDAEGRETVQLVLDLTELRTMGVVIASDGGERG